MSRVTENRGRVRQGQVVASIKRLRVHVAIALVRALHEPIVLLAVDPHVFVLNPGHAQLLFERVRVGAAELVHVLHMPGRPLLRTRALDTEISYSW